MLWHSDAISSVVHLPNVSA